MARYIIIVILGALSYGGLTSFAKVAYGQGYNASEITFAQTFLGSVVLWGIVVGRSVRKKTIQSVESIKLLLAGTSMGVATYSYYLSIEYIPASLAIVLLMQMTWMSVLAEWAVFKKKPSVVEILASAFIVIGSLLAANFLKIKESNFSVVGIALGLLSALLYTLYILFTSKLGKSTPVFEKSALMTTGSAFIIFAMNYKALSTSINFNFGLIQWGIFLAIFGTIIPPICFTVGMPKIGAGLSSTLLTLELPAAIFSAHVILGEKIYLIQIIGILMMIGAIVCINFLKKK
ncbi:EamA family transporter [Chryseobacterium piperi]|nr:DMT family transporter [Chryseobacterium piperi]